MIASDNAVIKEECAKSGYNSNYVVQVMTHFKTHPYLALNMVLSLSTPDTILKQLQNAYDELLKERKIKPVN